MYLISTSEWMNNLNLNLYLKSESESEFDSENFEPSFIMVVVFGIRISVWKFCSSLFMVVLIAYVLKNRNSYILIANLRC